MEDKIKNDMQNVLATSQAVIQNNVNNQMSSKDLPAESGTYKSTEGLKFTTRPANEPDPQDVARYSGAGKLPNTVYSNTSYRAADGSDGDPFFFKTKYEPVVPYKTVYRDLPVMAKTKAENKLAWEIDTSILGIPDVNYFGYNYIEEPSEGFWHSLIRNLWNFTPEIVSGGIAGATKAAYDFSKSISKANIESDFQAPEQLKEAVPYLFGPKITAEPTISKKQVINPEELVKNEQYTFDLMDEAEDKAFLADIDAKAENLKRIFYWDYTDSKETDMSPMAKSAKIVSSGVASVGLSIAAPLFAAGIGASEGLSAYSNIRSQTANMGIPAKKSMALATAGLLGIGALGILPSIGQTATKRALLAGSKNVLKNAVRVAERRSILALPREEIKKAAKKGALVGIVGEMASEPAQTDLELLLGSDFDWSSLEGRWDERALEIGASFIGGIVGSSIDIRNEVAQYDDKVKAVKVFKERMQNIINKHKPVLENFVKAGVITQKQMNGLIELAGSKTISDEVLGFINDSIAGQFDKIPAEQLADFEARLKAIDPKADLNAEYKILTDKVVAALEKANTKTTKESEKFRPEDISLIVSLFRGMANWGLYLNGIKPSQIPVPEFTPITTGLLDAINYGSTTGLNHVAIGLNVMPSDMPSAAKAPNSSYRNLLPESNTNLDYYISARHSNMLHEIGGHFLYNLVDSITGIKNSGKFLVEFYSSIIKAYGSERATKIMNSVEKKYTKGKERRTRYDSVDNYTENFAQAVGALAENAAKAVGVKGTAADFVAFANAMLTGINDSTILSKELNEYLSDLKHAIQENDKIISELVSTYGTERLNNAIKEFMSDSVDSLEKSNLSAELLTDLVNAVNGFASDQGATMLSEIFVGVDVEDFVQKTKDLFDQSISEGKKNVNNADDFAKSLYDTYIKDSVAAKKETTKNKKESISIDDVLSDKEIDGDYINIDGKERTVYNSNGDKIAKSEKSLRNFYKWFGDSKIVDEQGRPLVVYHGSEAIFDTFDNTQDKTKTRQIGAELGYFFTDKKSVAEKFRTQQQRKAESKYYKENTVITPVEEKKYDKDGNYLGSVVRPKAQLPEYRNFGLYEVYLKAENVAEYNGEMIGVGEERATALQSAKLSGKDGVIIYNADTGAGIANEYIVFEPNQIKSIDNNGDFSLDNNRVDMESDGTDYDTTDMGLPSIVSLAGKYDNDPIVERQSDAERLLNEKINDRTLEEDIKLAKNLFDKTKKTKFSKVAAFLYKQPMIGTLMDKLKIVGGEEFKNNYDLVKANSEFEIKLRALQQELSSRMKRAIAPNDKDIVAEGKLIAEQSKLAQEITKIKRRSIKGSDFGASEVSLTGWQIVDLYLNSKQGDKIWERTKAGYSDGAVEKVLKEHLTPEMKAIGDAFLDFMQYVKPMIEAARGKRIGVDEQFYFPIVDAFYNSFTNQDINSSMARDITSDDPLVADNALVLMDRYVRRLASALSGRYALTRRLANMFLLDPAQNILPDATAEEKAKIKELIKESSYLRRKIADVIGETGLQNLRHDLEKDLIYNDVTPYTTSGVFNKVANSIQKGLLSFKPVSFFKQATSLLGFWGEASNLRQYFADTAYGMAHPKEMIETMLKVKAVSNRLKGQGISDTLSKELSSGDSILTEIRQTLKYNDKFNITGNLSAMATFANRLGIKGFMQMGDAAGNIVGGYGLVKDWQRQGFSAEEIDIKFQQFIDEHQSSSNQAMKNALQKAWGRQGLLANFIAFTTEGVVKPKVYIDAGLALSRGEIDTKTFAKRIAPTLMAQIAFMMITSGIWDMFSEEEEVQDEAKKSLINEAINALFGITPLGNVFIAPIFEYALGTADIATFSPSITTEIRKALNDIKEGDIKNIIARSGSFTGMLSGAPALFNSIEGMIRRNSDDERERAAGTRQAFGRTKVFADKRAGIKEKRNPKDKNVEK